MAGSDHHTLRDFRSVKLKDQSKKIFDQVVSLLAEEGCSSLKELYVEGPDIEANANRYKGIKTSGSRIERQLKELLLPEEGIAHRKKRCWDEEAVFGNMKIWASNVLCPRDLTK